MKTHAPHRLTERGNAIFLILIAVALIGALTVTLSRSGSSVENLGNSEKVRIEALAIMRHMQSITLAAENLTFQGTSENDLSFENPLSTIDYTNANCTAADCKLFDIRGAGLSYLTPKTKWLDTALAAQPYYGDWLFTGNACIPDVGRGRDVTCNTNDGQLELLVVLPYVKKSLCQSVNKQAKTTITTNNPPVDTANAWHATLAPYTGTFTNAQPIADTNEDLFAQKTGCFAGGGTPAANSYHIYHVIKAR